MKKILITGTKGKTSMSMFIDSIVKNSLVVNSEFLKIKENNKIKYFKSGKDLFKIYTSINTWCPFKFLILSDFFNFDYYIAETDINNSFSEVPGIGIGTKIIDIGILTNVFEEHIDGKLIKSYEKLIEKKLRLIFDHTSYKDNYYTDVVININSSIIYEVLTKILPNYKNRNYNLHLAILEKTNIKPNKLDYLKSVIYYNESSFNGESLKEYKLSFNGVYLPSASILSILYLLQKILNKDFNLKELTFPKGLGRMEIIEKNGNTFLIDNFSELNAFKSLINMIISYFKGKKVNLIFALKYDALEPKIEMYSKYFNELLDKGIINKLYLYDNLQVRGLEKVKSKNKEYKAFDLPKKFKEKVPKAEILLDRDQKIKEILSRPHKDEIFVITLNTIESDYLKKTFGLY